MRIKEIRKLSEQFTVDIEVSDTHTYQLSNGCVSHNTVSELVQSSSGIHPKYSEYYIRTVRGSNDDPITKLMLSSGVPAEPDVTKPEKTTVFAFPIHAGSAGVTRDMMSAIEQLEHQKMFNEHWTDHNVSITVYVRNDEWLEVGSWIYKNWNNVYATSFLPHSDHVYAQAPFQEITKEQYDEFFAKMPTVDWTKLSEFEKEDKTEAQQNLACVAGVCSII